MVNRTIRPSSNCLRGMRPVRAVSTGAPMATPSAYRLTSRPADGTETPRLAAMVGISPTMTNSVVPMANAESVSAQSASGMLVPYRGGGRLACSLALGGAKKNPLPYNILLTGSHE